jgi:hypothetical protein
LPDGCGPAEVRGGGAGSAVDLGEVVFGASEADLEAFAFAEPAFAFGFGDAGGQDQLPASRSSETESYRTRRALVPPPWP